jgi:hypothetical protein
VAEQRERTSFSTLGRFTGMNQSMSQQCPDRSRRASEIQHLCAAANTLRQAKLQDQESLTDNPADRLLCFEWDRAITD